MLKMSHLAITACLLHYYEIFIHMTTFLIFTRIKTVLVSNTDSNNDKCVGWLFYLEYQTV